MAASTPASVAAALAAGKPNLSLDIFSGVWKRTLQTRLLGSFMPYKDVSTIVAIDRAPEDIDSASKRKRAARYRWNFGPTIDSVRTGYTVEVLDASSTDAVKLCVNFSGKDCYGMYQQDLGVLTMHLVGAISATLVYKVLDEDTLAVSITEFPAKSPPIIQYGFMFRLRS